MPFLDLLLLVVIVGIVSIYLDRRFIRNRGASPKTPAAAPAPAPPAASAVSAAEEVQEVKNGSN